MLTQHEKVKNNTERKRLSYFQNVFQIFKLSYFQIFKAAKY